MQYGSLVKTLWIATQREPHNRCGLSGDEILKHQFLLPKSNSIIFTKFLRFFDKEEYKKAVPELIIDEKERLKQEIKQNKKESESSKGMKKEIVDMKKRFLTDKGEHHGNRRRRS